MVINLAAGEVITVDSLKEFLATIGMDTTPVVAKYGSIEARHTLQVKEIHLIDGQIVIVVE